MDSTTRVRIDTDGYTNAWVDPAGKLIPVNPYGHRDWLRANTAHWDERDLLDLGWVRVSGSNVFSQGVSQVQLDALFDCALARDDEVLLADIRHIAGQD